jgi:hypothetical protein
VVSAAALSAAAGVAGLAYYLTVTGKLTADTGGAAGSARLAGSASSSPPGRDGFDVIATPYLRRTAARDGRVRLWEGAVINHEFFVISLLAGAERPDMDDRKPLELDLAAARNGGYTRCRNPLVDHAV